MKYIPSLTDRRSVRYASLELAVRLVQKGPARPSREEAKMTVEIAALFEEFIKQADFT
jgi:hypothetical protein